MAGAITAFAASLGEFGAIITFVSNIPGETRTLPLAIYTALQTPGGEAEAARLSALSIVLAFLFLLAAQAIMRRATRKDGAMSAEVAIRHRQGAFILDVAFTAAAAASPRCSGRRAPARPASCMCWRD